MLPRAALGELANESDGDDPDAVAIDPDGPAFAEVVAPLLGWPMTIVVGSTERGHAGSLRSSAAVFTDGRLAGVQRKAYTGGSRCVPGTELPLFVARGVTFGVLCNDAHYIELARVLVARGAQLLVVPVHGGHRPDKEARWRARGTNVLVARAVENGVPLVAADVAGWQGSRVCHGTTVIIDDQGRIVASAPELQPGIVVADVEISDGLRGGMDGNPFGLANPTVVDAFLELWRQPDTPPT